MQRRIKNRALRGDNTDRSGILLLRYQENSEGLTIQFFEQLVNLYWIIGLKHFMR